MRELEEKIATRIRQEGPIPFRDFMAMALYDPEFGYYMRRATIGRGGIFGRSAPGDYVTSPHLHPIFGELLAEEFLALLRDLDKRQTPTDIPTRWETARDAPPLTILEWGAGTGQLAADILAAWSRRERPLRGLPEQESTIRYLICEISPHYRDEQCRRLSAYPQVTWIEERDLDAERVVGIVFSNELLDAFPVHRVFREGRRWRELYVARDGERFVWTAGELTRPEIVRYFEEVGVELPEGHIADVAFEITSWVERIAAILHEGYLVTIDYGETAEHLYGRSRPWGTLRCFFRHQLVLDPFVRVGEQDITASVDFTLLMMAGRRCGLEVVEFTTQREFLMKLGLLERAAALLSSTGDRSPSVEELSFRLALKPFLMPGEFGQKFKVLIQRKRP